MDYLGSGLKRHISRRIFLKKTLKFLVGLGLIDLLGDWCYFDNSEAEEDFLLKEAMFYKKLDNQVVQCKVCFRRCILENGQRSFCRNKENKEGRLYSLVYARPSAVQIDPIEKEPCFHMLPGTEILCFGTAGCNFRCKFCHNWHLSQRSIEEMGQIFKITPQDAVKIALDKKIPTLSFTYNEPSSFYEFVYETAVLAKKNGLKILWHTNGSLNPEPLRELLKYTDAVTVDLKSFTEEFYQNISEAKLEPVLNTLKFIKEEGKWLEIVNLVIPTLNDDLQDIKRMCLWIKENLGKDIPLHFSRFFPNYKLTSLPATPITTLELAYRTAKEVGLDYVTIGNVPGHIYNSTFCPFCDKVLIERRHFTVLNNNIVDGRCKFCKNSIPGIWS
ncbi:MAG: AmmeMemoRadiSam system radical SAM enzyme [Candidatus Omnitrophica bacterium]|nr:AmmeMemoRadiSam system radical SAM enzyme [Candidatus Omnitrophota bacterium]